MHRRSSLSHPPRRTPRLLALLATGAVAMGGLAVNPAAVADPAPQHQATDRTGVLPAQDDGSARPGPPAIAVAGDETLYGVHAVSAKDVWGVGTTYGGATSSTLVEHSTGSAWAKVASPDPEGQTMMSLLSVDAASAHDVWSVGWSTNGTQEVTLAEHWNGRTWKIVPTPNPDSGNAAYLSGVTVVSANDVWAAGSYGISSEDGSSYSTLLEHWNGRKWRIVPSPNPVGSSSELATTASSAANDVWCVGDYTTDNGASYLTLVEHWDGNAWSVVASPNPAGATWTQLTSVSAVSTSDAWAVGWSTAETTNTFAMHWDGQTWSEVASPSPGEADELDAVSMLSPHNGWAVGYSFVDTGLVSLVEHWNGHHWRQVASPNPEGAIFSHLFGVTAASRHRAWAVGESYDGTSYQSLVERWDGAAWQLS
jgi:hypothetical protein